MKIGVKVLFLLFGIDFTRYLMQSTRCPTVRILIHRSTYDVGIDILCEKDRQYKIGVPVNISGTVVQTGLREVNKKNRGGGKTNLILKKIYHYFMP